MVALAWLTVVALNFGHSKFGPVLGQFFESAFKFLRMAAAAEPRKYQSYQLETLARAIVHLKSNEGVSERSVAQEFSVPRSTLQRKSSTLPDSIQISKKPKKEDVERVLTWLSDSPKAGNPNLFHLAPSEEEYLCQWLLTMSKHGMSLSLHQFNLVVTRLLKAKGKDVHLTQHFYDGFFERHKELALRKGQVRDNARSEGENSN